jgi:DNA helicase II / ATP-dependent DNA helicase PcrA
VHAEPEPVGDGDEAPDPATVFSASASSALRALAGPGTGKTYALVKRLAHLLEQGVDPRRILVVTFARTAARDLVAAVATLEAAGGELIQDASQLLFLAAR